jgi:hypothetical protein
MNQGKAPSRIVVAIAIAAGLAVAIPLPIASFGVFSSECGPGPVVATLPLSFTPRVIADSPLFGTASGSLTIHNGSTTYQTTFRGAENGTVWIYFGLENWTVTANTAKAGNLGGCSSAYLASVQDTGDSVIGPIPAQGVNFTNDSQAPTFSGSNLTGAPIIYYYAGFYAQSRTLSTCGSGTVNLTTSSNYLRVGLGFEAGGEWHILNETLDLQTEYSYEFLGNSGTWGIDNLSAPGGPGGGWSFSYLGGC